MIYGIIMMVVGGLLSAAAAAIAVALHRRWSLPYALLTVGMLTYLGAFFVQFVLLRGVGETWLNVLAVRALLAGVLIAFSESIARLLGFLYLARTAVTRPQAMMIGLGHGLVPVLYTSLLAAGLGLSLLGYDAERPDDMLTFVSGALAEALNGLLPLALHMALSWLVLQVFIRQAWWWLFAAIFLHAVSEIAAILLGPSDAWPVVVWRAAIALIALLVLARVRPPEETASPGGTAS